MKLTGIIIMLMGVVSLFAFGLMLMQAPDKPGQANANAYHPSLAVPLVMGLAGCIGGALILLYGGRGYVVLPKNRQIQSHVIDPVANATVQQNL